MARFGSLIGVGLAATMMIAAPSFAATTTAKPATTAVKPAAKPVKQAAAKPKPAPQRVAAARPNGHMAVSYTHLDVYKRQGPDCD